MVTQPNRTFVYGRFLWPGKSGFERLKGLLGPPEIAIEILREFSPVELIGKVYYRGSTGVWVPVDPGNAPSYEFYKWYSKSKRVVFFEMEGAGRWNVVYFRNESDQAGPYLAVALKLAPERASS